MDRGTVFYVLALNVIAVSVLYHRFGDHEYVRAAQSHVQQIVGHYFPQLSPQHTHRRCGTLDWSSYAIASEAVVFPDGVRPATIHIKDSKIVKIEDGVHENQNRTLKFRNAVISPGIVDVHIHMNEPGREHWEGITTATRAAAAGGITTVIDMPLNSNPVTTTLVELQRKQQVAAAKAHINVGFWAGLVPENAHNHSALAELVDAGALGFKSFMCPSGIHDFTNVGRDDIAAALPFLKKRGIPFFVHAEVVSDVPLDEAADPADYATYMNSRPPKFEQDAIEMLIEVLDADVTTASAGFVVHVAHLADADSLQMILEARQRHPLQVETCAHYLVFSAEKIADGQTHFKCAPPIRSNINKEKLLDAVVAGQIDLVSSDHSPAPPSMKQVESGNFLQAWGGISGVQYLLPATWTSLKGKGATFDDLARLLSETPAKLAGISTSKGQIAEGKDADLIVWEPESPANTSVHANQHQHKLSPYTDLPLQGKVLATFVRGNLVHLLGQLAPKPCGALITGRDQQPGTRIQAR